MSEHTAVRFSKVKKLITVLRKCNGKSVIGDDGSGLISPRAAKVLLYIGIAAAAGIIVYGMCDSRWPPQMHTAQSFNGLINPAADFSATGSVDS